MFGEYAPFIIPAYSLTIVTLSGAAILIFLNYRMRKAELKALEEKFKK
ncbi:MAG: heme exporter protein CcmD [Pseudomonadota bacterium]